jgi:hypothetical protein
MTSKTVSREVIHSDALYWLRNQTVIANVVTGICDMDDMDSGKKMSHEEYLKFFQTAARLIMEKVDPEGYVIFIQTSRKYQRSLIDKSFLLSKIAEQVGLKMIWHKIVLQREVDARDLYRPTYSHMLCYSKRGTTGAATPDVIPVSKKLYKNGTPIEAAVRAIRFIKAHTGSEPIIVDPFVGRGTVLAVANALGMSAIGIDMDERQVEYARRLKLDVAQFKSS